MHTKKCQIKIEVECQKLITAWSKLDLWLLLFLVLTSTERQPAELLWCHDLLTLGLHLQEWEEKGRRILVPSAIWLTSLLPPSLQKGNGVTTPSKGARQVNSPILRQLRLKVIPVQQVHAATCKNCTNRPRPACLMGWTSPAHINWHTLVFSISVWWHQYHQGTIVEITLSSLG